jgi:hypothetical protein
MSEIAGKTTNWDEGFKRIACLLCILGAVVGAGWVFFDSLHELTYHTNLLAKERRAEFGDVSNWLLINEWKMATTLDEQDALWVKWTGFTFTETPHWRPFEHTIEPNDPNKPAVVGYLLPRPTTEELPQLKKQGWVTAKGEPLPLTPEGVWLLKHDREIKDLEQTVSEDQIGLLIIPIFAAGIGFALAFALYVAIRGGVVPLLVWITRGFREDGSKDGNHGGQPPITRTYESRHP